MQDSLKESPPPVLWRGESAMLARVASVLPFGMLDGHVKKVTRMDVVEKIVR